MQYGYMGKILKIDMRTEKVSEILLADEDIESYIGGSGFGARLLYMMTEGKTEPLSPDNPLIFMTGPLTGTKAFSSNRFEVVTRSPLTGIYIESDCGGHWGGMLKRCGWDGIVITGKSTRPAYLWLSENEVEIRDAGKLWGMDTFQTQGDLKKETVSEAEIVCIGPAGENLVLLASIMTDGVHGRAAGRGGVGAVMGSKNLKAIAVWGRKKVNIADRKGLNKFVKIRAKNMLEGAKVLTDYGTSCGLEHSEIIGNLPIKNWYQRRFEEGASKICGQTMAETILAEKYACGGCIVRCGRSVHAGEGGNATDDIIGGPEYETLALFGSNLLIDELDVIVKSNELCNRFGLDTISTGSVIGFSMEAFERGLITAESAGGIELRWGDGDLVHDLIHRIAHRNGIGKLMGRGVKKFADELEGTAHEFAIHVKGLEFPAHDPRAKSSLALAYATSNRGACHLQALSMDFEEGFACPSLGFDKTFDRFTSEGKAELVVKSQNVMSIFDSLKSCKFLIHFGMEPDSMVECLNLVTGLNMTKEELLKAGERIFNLKRMFNVRCGISRKDDAIPLRIATNKRGNGNYEDSLPHLSIMLNEYYKLRGWDEMGIPKSEKLTELGLEWCRPEIK